MPTLWTNSVIRIMGDKIANVSDESGAMQEKFKAPRTKRVALPKPISIRVSSTLSTANLAGLLAGKKEKRVSGRAHEQLFRAAAERSGLDGSELIEYALAKVALEDDFADKLLALTGTVDRELDLEF